MLTPFLPSLGPHVCHMILKIKSAGSIVPKGIAEKPQLTLRPHLCHVALKIDEVIARVLPLNKGTPSNV
jgi:hypothetical protein